MLSKHLEEKEALLAARRYLYSLFQSIIGNEPSSELFQAISLPLVREAFVILELEDVHGFICAMENLDINNAKLKGEYTSLFIGPNKLPAPPWESVYITGERLILQRLTLEVRNIYRSLGYIPKLYPKVADDHLALELDFLRLLADRTINAFVAQKNEDYKEALRASLDFLNEHLLKWVDSFANLLSKYERNSFYSITARALSSFTVKDEETLVSLLDFEAYKPQLLSGVDV